MDAEEIDPTHYIMTEKIAATMNIPRSFEQPPCPWMSWFLEEVRWPISHSCSAAKY